MEHIGQEELDNLPRECLWRKVRKFLQAWIVSAHFIAIEFIHKVKYECLF